MNRWIALVALCLLSMVARPADAKFERQTLEVPGSILWVTTGDLDGDKKTDLVVSYRRGSGPTSSRFIAIFFRGDKGYGGRPDVAFAVPKNAAAFDVGDAFGDAQDEIAYLTSSGVFAQPFKARRPGNPTRVVASPTLVLSPEEDDLVSWDFLRRLEKGGPPTIILPGRRELQLFRRDGEVWKPWSSVRIKKYSYYDAETSTYRRSGRGGSSGRPYSLRVTTIVPNIDFVDQTGDKKIDLVTHYEDRVEVYPMTAEGVLSRKPTKRQWFRVRTAAELESRDTRVSASVQDLDGDGIADLCITKIGGGITTLRSVVYLHRGLRGGGFVDKPTQTFSDDGFGALVVFEDVDRDGKVEMLHPHSEVSIVALSRAMLSSSLSLDLRIRRRGTDGQFFEPRPVQTLETSFGLDLTVGATLRGAAPMFGHDFDQDGRLDVVLAQGGDKMKLHRGLKGSDEMFEEEGRITLSAPGSSTTFAIAPNIDGTGPPDVLVYYVARKSLGGRMYVFLNKRNP